MAWINRRTINVITKDGSRDFHGGACTFYRHESLNANTFFNNRGGVQGPVYRYRISGCPLLQLGELVLQKRQQSPRVMNQLALRAEDLNPQPRGRAVPKGGAVKLQP